MCLVSQPIYTTAVSLSGLLSMYEFGVSGNHYTSFLITAIRRKNTINSCVYYLQQVHSDSEKTSKRAL